MREFKFRIWAKEAKKWIAPEMFAVYEKGIYPFGISPESVELQQFTGLKDVNGKEIYEGDFLKISEEDRKDYFKDYCHVWFSDFGGYAVSFNHMYSETSCPLFSIASSYEVAGNIFENPELLP
jgi:uncharacterized phage protein (TIGR01671 family)